MPTTWELRDRDQELFARELDSFVPPEVFDVHAHLYRADWWDDPPGHVRVGPPEVTPAVYREQMQWILPGRQVQALHFAYPFPANDPQRLRAANEWVSTQLAAELPPTDAPPAGERQSPPPAGGASCPACRETGRPAYRGGQLLLWPGDDPEAVREQARALGLRGLKPFCFYAPVADTWQAEVPDYLPEPVMAVADQEGWTITLHLMRSRGIADRSNQHWVRRYCERYPNAQIILDHCARGFNPYHVLEGLPTLAGLGNLWVDTSAVCDPLAVLAALEVVGPGRLLYGSDFYVSHIRGHNFALGDSFLWLDEDSSLPPAPYAGEWSLPLVGLENLRAVKAAFRAARLTDSQVEAYFSGNARTLLAV